MIQSYESEQGEEGGHVASAEELMENLGDNIIELFFAGYNTVAAAVGTAMHFLSRDRSLQGRVQQEAEAALDDVVAGGTIDLNKLPLCEAVFMEALRVAGPVPLVYRITDGPTDLGPGCTLPAGTIWIPAEHIHKDPKTWGADAAEFRPDRWLENDGQPPVPGSFLAFSLGPRECIGRHFARLEAVSALAVLCKYFSFRAKPDFKFAPTFTGFGVRPFDGNSNRVCVDCLVERRVTAETLFDWSWPSSVAA